MLEVRFNWHKPVSRPNKDINKNGEKVESVKLVIINEYFNIKTIYYYFEDDWQFVNHLEGVMAWAYEDDMMPQEETNGNSRVNWFNLKEELPQVSGTYIVVLKEYRQDNYETLEKTYITHRRFYVTNSRSVFASINTEEVLYWTTANDILSDERLMKGLGL